MLPGLSRLLHAMGCGQSFSRYFEVGWLPARVIDLPLGLLSCHLLLRRDGLLRSGQAATGQS
jgi:hypothetical protein